MDFGAEHKPYEDEDAVAVNGEVPVQEQTQQLSSDRGIEPFDVVDSAENELKQSLDDRDSSSGKLFVGGISWETTEETFSNYFSKYGEITDSVIMMDKHSGRPRGFGFVTFADPAVTDKVLADDHFIDGRTVEVKRTVPREDMQQVKGVLKTKKIFIGGIPPSFSEDELKEYFSAYGSIVEHQIMLDHKTGRPRGFGFVTFEDEESVEKIFSEDRNHELGGKQVEIKRAQPKRAGGDYFGVAAKSHGGFASGSARYGGGYSSAGGYGGKMGGGYGGYDSYGGYGNYGGYGGGGAAGFYGGFGGYGYGFGFGGPMYSGAGYGGADYGYGSGTGYGGGRGYAGGSSGRGYGGGAGGGYGSTKGYGSGNAASGTGRHHPYRN
ncbi:heterogeneous nuclear ribonucleoprotein 1 [Malania oleifera]|uniref:heterogeneous nuclear ribonucleoprotein 1 n=1 Tax=Malania oleifera TaxID=397392 RepID=UPI0025AE2F74|nr:heterogeneous nuclear ribonucleoprotein 1 [Malania oleifera]